MLLDGIDGKADDAMTMTYKINKAQRVIFHKRW